ncbi:MAG: DUF1573 domain-containing protein [Thermoanaerobaculia bacterium]|nr:DUF1573 domain-containing protein [Thermoanaerobaculia bacterium]
MSDERTTQRHRGLATGLLLAFAALAAAAQAPAPRAVVEQPVVDVGNVNRGKPIRRDFVIRNAGTAPLEITEVKPACGCTVADYDEEIAPGASGKVTVVVKTTSFRGPIAKAVTVFTNDPESPQAQLVVKANIRTDIEVEPSYARFVVVQGEEYPAAELELKAVDDRPFRVLEVASPVPFLETSTSGEGSEWTVRIELAQRAPVGPIADFVVITTDHPRQPEVRVPVSGFVRPPVVVIPQVYDFGRRKIEEPYPGKVQVKVVGSGVVKLGEVTSSLPGVEAEVEEVEPGKVYNLVIRLQPDLATGPAEGTVTVRTDNARYPVLEVPVRGTVL